MKTLNSTLAATRRRSPALAIGLLLAFFAAAAPAPGSSVAPDRGEGGAGALQAFAPDGSPLGGCPLEHTDVAVEISGFVARVVVKQTFSNPFPEPIEAIYTFPLSERGAVDDMWMRTGDRVIRGTIERREKARRLYEQARREGRLASLLDQERPNVFTQSLANLLPGTKVEIEIHYVETLRYDAGAYEFSFPTVVGPRFVPGAPQGSAGSGWSRDTDRVPDASRITPPVAPEGTRAGHDLAIAVDIDAGVPIRSVESKLHEVDVESVSDTRKVVRLRRRAEIPNRDFVVRFGVAADAIRSGYLAHREERRDGYVSFVLLPPERITPGSVAPRELVFVVDRSGSQRGLPLAKAKETLLWILDHMNPNDTFQVVDFSNTTNMLFDRPQPANPAMKRQARAYIEALQANGGTFMAEAIERLASIPADGNRLRIVTMMTDGYIGNDFEVIDLVRRVRGTSRWFVFGTGNSTNRFLLEGMAREGGGEVEIVLLNTPGEEVARRFHRRIASPVLTDVRLEFRGLDVVDVYPRQVSDVWARRPLVVHARYRRPGRGRVILQGFRQGEPYRQELDVILPDREERNGSLASIWARSRVDDLMGRALPDLQSGRVSDRLKEQIVSVALEHRLVTQFTSFVAVEERIVNEGGVQRTITVPVEMPQGVTHEGVFGARNNTFAGARLGAEMAEAPVSAYGYMALGSRSMFRGYAPNAPRASVDEVAMAPAPAEPIALSLSKRARGRLHPALLRLLEPSGGARPARVEIRDGRVTVKVALRDASEATVERLEALGLRIHQRMDGFAIGTIAVEDLPRLAELEVVVRIEPA